MVDIYLRKEDFNFCIRLSTAWKTAYKTIEASGKNDIDFSLKKLPSQEYGKLKTYDLPAEVSGLRLVSVDLPNGNKEILLTSLCEREVYSVEVLKELYHMRWGVEECYSELNRSHGWSIFL